MADTHSFSPIRVLLVDDQRAILSGLSALVDSAAPQMRVVGLADNPQGARELARRTDPNVIVLDADLDGDDGLALIPLLRNECAAAIVVFTASTDPSVCRRALALGAARCLSKAAPADSTLAAIRSAAP